MRRKNSIRKAHYNYSNPRGYFITFNTHKRERTLGRIHNGKMELNKYGKMVEYTWLDLPNHNSNIELDEFIIMPDHFHGIIFLTDKNGRIQNPPNFGRNMVPPPHGLSEIIRQLKSFSTRRINELRGTPGNPVWHRGYHDKIIWTDNQLINTRRYILNNPIAWQIKNHSEKES